MKFELPKQKEKLQNVNEIGEQYENEVKKYGEIWKSESDDYCKLKCSQSLKRKLVVHKCLQNNKL